MIWRAINYLTLGHLGSREAQNPEGEGSGDSVFGTQSQDPGFLPYACHYDRDTILCKDAQLMQTFEITGFSPSQGIRSALRQSVKDYALDPYISIWVHSVRTKEGFTFPKEKTGDFAESLHQSMIANKKYRIDFINRLYITVTIRQKKRNSLSLEGLNAYLTRRRYGKYLQDSRNKLGTIVDKMMEKLGDFAPKRLAATDDGYSSALSFLYFLTHFSRQRTKLPFADLSNYLTHNTRYKFGFNAFVVRSEDSDTKFCNVLTIKDHGDVPHEVLDGFMQIESEFVITEVINFTQTKKQVESLKYQKYLLDISGDQEMMEHLRLQEDNDFSLLCHHSVNIVPISNSMAQLENLTDKIVADLAAKGMQIVRDDLTMEQKFWFCLPANRSFCWKMAMKSLYDTCSFAGLQHFPTGNHENAFALFWSTYNSPYLFGFATETSEYQNAIILGKSLAGKTVLQNFLLAESRNLNSRIVILDHRQKSRVFIKSLKGQYKVLMDDELQFTLNPLEGPLSQQALIELVASMGITIDPEQLENIDLATLHHQLGPLGNMFAKTCNWRKHQVLGLDLSMLESQGDLKGPLGTLIMYNMIASFPDMENALILIEEPFRMFTEFFADEEALKLLLDSAHKHQIKLVFSAEETGFDALPSLALRVKECFNSVIILPGLSISKEMADVLNLSKEDLLLIRLLNGYERHFFLKQESQNAILKLDFVGMKEVYALSSTPTSVAHMEAAIAQVGSEDPRSWLEEFYSRCAGKSTNAREDA